MGDTEEKDTVTSIVFQKAARSGVDFEVALTAIVVSAVLATLPSGFEGALLTTGSLLLSVITVIRWMSINGRFSDDRAIISTSTRPVELLSVVGVFHIIGVVVHQGQRVSPWTFNELLATATGAILASLTIIVVMELLFRNYRIWWGSVFYVRTLATKREVEETDGFRSLVLFLLFNVWAQTAYIILKDTIPDDKAKEWDELRQFIQNVEDDSDGTPSVSSRRLMLVTGVVVFPVFAVVAGILSVLFGSFVEMFVLILAVWCLRHVVGFLYLAYGTSRLDDFLLSNRQSLVYYISYAAFVYLVLY